MEEIYAVLRHKKISHSTQEVTEKMACLIGVEPTAFRLGGGPSILLRYRQMCQNYSTIQKLLQKIFDTEIIPKTIPDII